MTARRVIVAVREPATGSDVLPYASFAATLMPAAEIHLVHVLDVDDPAAAGSFSDICYQLAALARRFPNAVSRVLEGDRLDCLLQYTSDTQADVIILGHRRSRFDRRSLARRLAMKAPCSVWMAPEGSTTDIRRVLVGVDFSEDSLLAVQAAGELAALGRAEEVVAFHVTQDFDAPLWVLEKFVARAGVPVRVRYVLDEGPTVSDACAKLIRTNGGDLVVVGARGTNPSTTVLLGIEAEQVLWESPVPVFVATLARQREGLLEALFSRRQTSRAV